MYRRRLPVLLATLVTLAASACGTTTDPSEPPPSSGADDPDSADTSGAVESRSATPRLAVTHDGGVMVVDVTSGDVVLEESLPGFIRVSPAGDGRHVLVAGEGGWRALDLGSRGSDHGDHGHHWTGSPALTDVEIGAEEPGHVVAHHGHTTLFDDGTGTATFLDPEELADGTPATTTLSTGAAHHGVAVRLDDRNVVHTVGTEESRSGVRLVSPAGRVLAETGDCPGVHGEAVTSEAVVLGCEDGAVVVSGREIRKVQSPDAYGRIGNQAGSDSSPVLLGDYKVDPDAELERPTRISLIDTRDASLRLVDLGTSYSFRSLGRGPDGEALVLGTDGALHVIDPGTGRRTGAVEVVAPWREPMDWQQPRPTLHVVEDTAYVTDPRRDRIRVVDLRHSRVVDTIALPHTPNEVVANAG